MSILQMFELFVISGFVGFTIYCLCKFIKGFIKGYRDKNWSSKGITPLTLYFFCLIKFLWADIIYVYAHKLINQ